MKVLISDTILSPPVAWWEEEHHHQRDLLLTCPQYWIFNKTECTFWRQHLISFYQVRSQDQSNTEIITQPLHLSCDILWEKLNFCYCCSLKWAETILIIILVSLITATTALVLWCCHEILMKMSGLRHGLPLSVRHPSRNIWLIFRVSQSHPVNDLLCW